MGRPREFDTKTAIDDAMQLFWTQGYCRSSISDLLDATGLERGSLYKAFGDKHSLFELAINRYLKAGRAAMRQVLAADDPPLRRLNNWMSGMRQGCSGAAGGPGCLAVNAMVELAPSDVKIRTLLTRHWALVERALANILAEGQRTGDVRSDMPPIQLAQVMVRTVIGTAALSRQGDRSDLTDVALRLVSAPSV